jgi:RNA polymerase sigma-70 factor (ECF subfamily)
MRPFEESNVCTGVTGVAEPTMTRTSGQLAEDSGAQLRGTLRAFIARRVPDPDTADDLAQEVLLKAYRSGATTEDVGDVAAWLYRIARNTVVDYYRSRDRQPGLGTLPENLVSDGADDDDHAVRQLARCLRPLVAELEPIYRDALTFTDLDGLTQTEAARRAGISVSGMKSRVQRARTQLKAAISACCAIHTDAAGRISDYDPPPECHC